jgi:peroxiredoxin Q/BCP
MFRIAFIVALVVVAIVVFLRFISYQELPPVGNLAPEFTLPSQEGLPVSLAEYRGHWIVLYFYP